MADIVSETSGTQTLTGSGTEDDLHTAVADADVYQYAFDLVNMSDGDELEIRISYKVLTGSTAANIVRKRFKNSQADPVYITPPIPSLFSIQAHATEISASGFDLPWQMISYSSS